MRQNDTIYALSSGGLPSAVAVLRLSGSESAAVVMGLCGRLPAERRGSLRTLRGGVNGDVIDQAIVLWLPGPGTVTGEDMAELQVHGSRAVVARLFHELGRFSGVRAAEAGEFTRRAFGNGKMDLVEVAGLDEVLRARTERQRVSALARMDGGASRVIETWRHSLLEALALVDASIEFAEEGDVSGLDSSGWREIVDRLESEMRWALALASRGRSLRDGVRVAIAGRPNVGKSSFLNWVAGREAAIVTDIAGTTRDIVEVQVELGGVPVVMQDTAGLRNVCDDVVEEIGVRRAYEAILESDVVVWVWSSDVPGSEVVDAGVVADFVIQNKIDLAGGSTDGGVSVRSGQGMAACLDSVTGLVLRATMGAEGAVVVDARESVLLEESIRFLNDARARGEGQVELVSADLMAAARSLGRLTGEIGVDEVLGAIFSRFCIGK